MKILSTEDFTKLPEGALFYFYHEEEPVRLAIKEETISRGDDYCEFLYTPLHELQDNNLSIGDSSPLEIRFCRPQPIVNDYLFAVWEKKDLLKLADIVQAALEVTKL